jgi:hypothetical protein
MSNRWADTTDEEDGGVDDIPEEGNPEDQVSTERVSRTRGEESEEPFQYHCSHAMTLQGC